MVEGDLIDLTLPSLMRALSMERSTVVLRLQRGTDQGSLFFCEGALVHALAGEAVGDDALCEVLGWPDGRFRLVRDADQQPRTITQRLASVIGTAEAGRSGAGPRSNGAAIASISADEQLLNDLLALLTRLEQDKVRLEEGQLEPGAVPALLVVTAVVNSMVAVVTGRCGDPEVLPSRVLPRFAEEQPYTQLLGEDMERISITTAAGVLKTWNSTKEDRQRLFLDLSRALLDVLTFYGNTMSTFFHSSREREEWRATFGVFVDGLWMAVNQVEVSA